MEVNMSRTARADDCGSKAPAGAAPTTLGATISDLTESLNLTRLTRVAQFRLKCRTKLCAERAIPLPPHVYLLAGQTPQLVHCFQDDRFRHVVDNLDSADFRGQHKVHHAIASLLVRFQKAQN